MNFEIRGVVYYDPLPGGCRTPNPEPEVNFNPVRNIFFLCGTMKKARTVAPVRASEIERCEPSNFPRTGSVSQMDKIRTHPPYCPIQKKNDSEKMTAPRSSKTEGAVFYAVQRPRENARSAPEI